MSCRTAPSKCSSAGQGIRRVRNQMAHLGEAEDVVHEEQHILALKVTEVLCDGEPGQRHAGARTRGLVHLPEHQRALALARLVADLVHALRIDLGIAT